MGLINEAQCRRLAISFSRALRGGKFNRVSKNFMVSLNMRVYKLIRDAVKNHPTKGKTITEI